MMEQKFPMKEFLTWFEACKRDFPWRKNPSFYEVLVSEFMLQQTVASVVVPYYLKWMTLFPSLLHLANSSLDSVLKAWEGLGYYSRARRLHAISQQIVTLNQNSLETYQDLKALKGIGDYTANAILAFAFNRPVVALDGNVLRVGARYFGIHQIVTSAKARKEINGNFEALKVENGSFAEALIELGATICKKKPDCNQCPLINSCYAYSHQKTESLPIVLKRKPIEKMTSIIPVCVCEDLILIKKQTASLMKDLYEFPKIGECLDNLLHDSERLEIGVFKRSFTSFQESLVVTLHKVKQAKLLDGMMWCDYKKLQDLPFSSGHRTIRDLIIEKLDYEYSSH